MNASTIKRAVPYYSQWESAGLVPEFVAGADSARDPLWAGSGAGSPEEYAFWAPRMCGVACLRMVLGRLGLPVPPSVELVKELCGAGAYVRDGDAVQGLIYQPFAEYVNARWDLDARSVPVLDHQAVRDALAGGGLAMLSVHWSIRTLVPAGEARGGHLVLAVGATDDAVLVHNPSGFPGASQQYAPVPWAELDRFYAGRGILIGGRAG
ncbi:C39 family peptidase [Streptomyces sp. NBC_00335]|uniref:C39 family peptidase n=1 Tax=unclassified Streptomyces TaxID=2593676 RepID=UPI002253E210|nr:MULTISPECIES: C39 family peptidase [unclassified Streptomyces]MCX5404545.1 C39 family peptidase [Streptomyces sp. NBC_00086]